MITKLTCYDCKFFIENLHDLHNAFESEGVMRSLANQCFNHFKDLEHPRMKLSTRDMDDKIIKEDDIDINMMKMVSFLDVLFRK